MNKSLQFVNSLHIAYKLVDFFYFLLQNIITLVFCKLTFNFHWWQYFSNIDKAYCISASVSERIIVSTAYSNEKSFTNISDCAYNMQRPDHKTTV